MSSTSPLSRAQLRQLLSQEYAEAADFLDFLRVRFPKVHHRLTPHMNRLEITNLFLACEGHNPDAVVAAIERQRQGLPEPAVPPPPDLPPVRQDRLATNDRPIAPPPPVGLAPALRDNPDFAQLSQEIDRVLPAASDFDAFLLDYFPAARRRCTVGMTRDDMLKVLLSSHSAAEILRVLGSS